jgi:type IV pilus assembly protein PilB
MIGEIRDFETAEIGVKAALTGHLVLSTLHTNDAPGTVSRLLNMGIEPFLVTASLNLILAQRLARRLCPGCKRAVKNIEEQALLDAGVPPDRIGTFTVYEKSGCRECNDRGYRGRVAVYEVMPFWDGLKELVINGASAAELKQESIRLGMQTLRSAALGKMMAGMTTLEEVLGNTAPDRF